MYKRIATAALVFGMSATAPPAEAQPAKCAPRDVIVKSLQNNHGETPQGVGLAGPLAAFELWISGTTGSWTMLLTRPNKISCVIATGSNWTQPIPSLNALGQSL